MFIGHFAVAFLLAWLFPQTPLWVFLVAVSFPDLLWSVLVPLGVEKVRIDPSSPLQRNIGFEKYPFSHSLVLASILALLVGIPIGVGVGNLMISLLFVAGSASHWLLDTVVHLKDLPVLGFGSFDEKVGFGLWRWGGITFFVELALYVVFAAAFVPYGKLGYALVLGILFHLVNANSFFGFSKKNIVRSSNGYAGLAFFGFATFSILGSLLV